MRAVRINNERGVSLVLVALSIVVLFGFGALAIDVAHLYHVKDQLQVAADAAALAGVNQLIITKDTGTAFSNETSARSAAIRIALMNVADVAYKAGIPTAAPGQPIPVTLQRNDANIPSDADTSPGDIVVGNWSPTPAPGFFRPATGSTGRPINAVEVVARRQGTIDSQPTASNWFAKIFKLLPGVNYDFTAISATAVAAITPAPILPIAVNEYWNEDGSNKPAKPWSQVYPQSFMRQINAPSNSASGTLIPSNLSGLAGDTFPILGAAANSNNKSFNLNSFVDILDRSRFHIPALTQTCPVAEDGSPTIWWSVNQDSSTGSSLPGCCNLSPSSTGVTNSGKNGNGVVNGDVNPSKYDLNFQYLFDGIPDNIVLPTAVFEIARSTNPSYPDDNYNNGNDPCYQATFTGANPPLAFPPVFNNYNDPSDCPYASIPYYSSSGGSPVGKKLDLDTSESNGLRFWQKYPKGTKFVIMVYDGTIQTNPDPSQANVVTIIGYGVIQVDGYTSTNISNSNQFRNLNSGGRNGSGGNTAYGHAIPHGVAGQADPYLIQVPDSPAASDSTSARKGGCSFTDIVRSVANKFGTVRLVPFQTNLGRYGVANQ